MISWNYVLYRYSFNLEMSSAVLVNLLISVNSTNDNSRNGRTSNS
jgi:hypothetical protein